jgi:hypothetical protein
VPRAGERRNEPVAPPIHCLNDPLAPPAIPNRPADPRNALLQGGIADKPVSPEALAQFLPQNDPVPVCDQIGQHREPLPVERDHAARPMKFVALHIQPIVPKDILYGPALLSSWAARRRR